MKYTLLLLSTIFVFSCSIQKRKYQKGFYVDWHHKKSVKDMSLAKSKAKNLEPDSINKTKEIVVSTGDRTELIEAAKQNRKDLGKKTFKFLRNTEDSCDILIFKDGTEIKAKVEEIGISEIKYKRCDSPDGPIYVTRKSDIFMVKYSNGTKEVFKTEAVVVDDPVVPINTYKTNRYKRVNHPLALPSLILGALSVFVSFVIGFIALDSYYVQPEVLFIPAILGLIAFILGSFAMNRIKSEPDVYKGKGMAIPGFIMGLIIFCIMAFIGLLILVFTL